METVIHLKVKVTVTFNIKNVKVVITLVCLDLES